MHKTFARYNDAMFEALLLLPLFIRLCKTFEAHPRLSLFKLGAFHHIELSILGRLQPDVSRCICGRGCRWGAPGHMWISFGPTSSQTRPSNSVQILRSCQVSRHSMLFMSALEYKCCLETTSSGFSDLKNVPNPFLNPSWQQFISFGEGGVFGVHRQWLTAWRSGLAFQW